MIKQANIEIPTQVSIDDQVVRLIGIPFFGLVIPSATGLISFEGGLTLDVILSHLYFIAIAAIVWQGNRYLVLRYYPVIFKGTSRLQKFTLTLGLNIFYTGPVAFLLLALWKSLTASTVSYQVLLITTVVIVVCVLFVTNIYEKVLFAKHTELEQLKTAELERAKIQAELEALKNQIDPHFMFNALNSVSYLVDFAPVKAKSFVESLADVYRYILRSKEKDLVLLRDEIDFMQSYARLMSLRHEDAFEINLVDIKEQENKYLIPPVSLMVAVENAVKHNEVSRSNHLVLDVRFSDESIVVHNKKIKRKLDRPSTKIGLQNLNDRFQKIIGKGISLTQSEEFFTLQMPLLKLSHG